jgi:pyruvate/2-oxoglutarate dehydrogenase complex dihydrolipoamide dehydrogenase (E3) component
MDIEELDLLVVGGGKAGKSLAMDAARAGHRVAMVERAMIGGTCINVACIPTKTIINSGRVLKDARRAAEFGIAGIEHPRMDIALLRHRKEDVGGTRTLRGSDVVVNLGTEPLLPDIAGLADSNMHTSNTLLELEVLPESIIVLGGGYVGCEFADFLNTIGVRVTVIQGQDQLLTREDADVGAAIQQAFTDAGITLRLGESAEKISRATDGTVTVTLSSGETVTAADILVAVGRTPVTSGANLAEAGIDLDDRGFIKVDEYLRTSAEHVWAAGDAAGTPQFTHASYDDYRVLKTNLAAQDDQAEMRSTAGRLIPYCVFTTPELGRVGLTEAQARNAGYEVRVARMPVSAIPRACTVGHLEGMWKAVVDRGTNRILGVALLGTEASEAIAVVQMAMQTLDDAVPGTTVTGGQDARLRLLCGGDSDGSNEPLPPPAEKCRNEPIGCLLAVSRSDRHQRKRVDIGQETRL